MIRVRNLKKDYRNGSIVVPALRGVDFDVGTGEFAAVVGPSGCGKSTILYILGGMLRATSGSAAVGAFDVTGARESALTEYRRSQVGFVFQKFNLLGALDVLGNLEVACRIAGRPADGPRLQAILESVGLAAKRRAKPAELSQGEQQRVAIARALVKEPNILLADEPTGNLDSANSRMIMDLFRRITVERRQTILMITHNETCARRADRIIAMQDGRTGGVGDVAEGIQPVAEPARQGAPA